MPYPAWLAGPELLEAVRRHNPFPACPAAGGPRRGDPDFVHGPCAAISRDELPRPFPRIFLTDVTGTGKALVEIEKHRAPAVHGRVCRLRRRGPGFEQRPRCAARAWPDSSPVVLRELRRPFVRLVVAACHPFEAQDCRDELRQYA